MTELRGHWMEAWWRGLQSWSQINGIGWMMVAFSERERTMEGSPGFFREEDHKFSLRHVEFKNFGDIQEAVLSRQVKKWVCSLHARSHLEIWIWEPGDGYWIHGCGWDCLERKCGLRGSDQRVRKKVRTVSFYGNQGMRMFQKEVWLIVKCCWQVR